MKSRVWYDGSVIQGYFQLFPFVSILRDMLFVKDLKETNETLGMRSNLSIKFYVLLV